MTHSPAPKFKLDQAEHKCCWDHMIRLDDDRSPHYSGIADVRDGYQNLFLAAPDLLYAGKRALMILAALANGIMVDESVIMQSGKELKAAISKAEPNEIK